MKDPRTSEGTYNLKSFTHIQIAPNGENNNSKLTPIRAAFSLANVVPNREKEPFHCLHHQKNTGQ